MNEQTMPAIDRNALEDQAARLVELARQAGADAADAVVVRGHSKSVSVRFGKVEETESSESDDFALRVFVGRRVASVSAGSGFDASELAARAVAMAKVSPDDDFNGLADPADLADGVADLDLFHPRLLSGEELAGEARAVEAAALDVKGVANSGGASASATLRGVVLVTSHGFSGAYMGTRYSRSVSVVAGEGTKMERDFDFDARLDHDELDSPEAIGRRAGERTVKRLGARQMPTARGLTVVFDPRVARGLLGNLAGAINGAAVARRTSFLRERMGQRIMAPGVTVTDDPLIVRGPGSRPFDGEGVRGERLAMVEDGVLKHWFLSSAAARELGLRTNGRGVRGGNAVGPSSTNLVLEPGTASPRDLIRDVGTGFYVTELIGHGVDMVTGEYSRGASGFWIENGELAFPVAEVTIASNLKDMLLRLTPADDVDRKFSTAAPTLAVEGMTLAGK